MLNRILLIEDEALIRYFLENRLKKENYNVDIAKDGKEAARKISENKYSLIISDLMLPFISGFDLISKIRLDDKNSDTPILVLSALSSENTIVEALSIGASDFIPKPFAVDVLLAKVKYLFHPETSLKAS